MNIIAIVIVIIKEIIIFGWNGLIIEISKKLSGQPLTLKVS